MVTTLPCVRGPGQTRNLSIVPDERGPRRGTRHIRFGAPPYARSVVRALLTPRMVALHALGALAATAAVLLGIWQYDAWQAGRELEARDLAGTTPAPLDSVLAPDAAFPNDQVGRPVTFSGIWLPAGTLEVAGRLLDGRVGRWAVTPVAVCAGLTPCDDAPAMLVVRGWVAAGTPLPPAPVGDVELTGWLQPGDGTGVADPDPDDAVLPELRIASAIQHVDQDLYGGYVIGRDLAGAAADGLEPLTPSSLPEPGSSTALRNLLYALEWWVFAGFGGFLWQRWVRDELAREGAVARAAAADGSVEAAGIRSST